MDNLDSSSSGLGYSYTVLEQQVALTLNGLVDKILPLEPAYSTTSSNSEVPSQTPSGTRNILENSPLSRFERALRSFQFAKEKACQAEEEAQAIVKKVNETSNTIDLYILLLDALKQAVDSVPDPKHSVALKTAQSQKSAPRRTQSVHRKDSYGDPSQVSFYNGRPPQMPRKTMKTRAPPPKPVLRPVSEEEFNGVSLLVRGKVKLADVNQAYAVLFNAFVNEEMEKIKLSELAKRGVGVSGMTEMAKVKVLRQLGRITLSTCQAFISPAAI